MTCLFGAHDLIRTLVSYSFDSDDIVKLHFALLDTGFCSTNDLVTASQMVPTP